MKRNIKLISTVLTIALIACVSLLHSCKEDESLMEIEVKPWQEKIVYMDIPCVDFSQIKKDNSLTKSTQPMLVFNDWEHYASVIDAMLEFSYEYIDTQIKRVMDENPDINEDDLSLILHNESVYQFMPLYSFCQQLMFDNSAFNSLRENEIVWMQNSESNDNENPFDDTEMGYIQSALHNSNGDVMIGNEIYNPTINDENDAKYICQKKGSADIKYGGNTWPTYNYNGKKREIRGYLKSNQNHSFAKTSLYYFNKKGKRIVWCANKAEVTLRGDRYIDCDGTDVTRSFFGQKKFRVSVVEKYCWYINGIYPNYLRGGDNPSVNSFHYAPGLSGDFILAL